MILVWAIIASLCLFSALIIDTSVIRLLRRKGDEERRLRLRLAEELRRKDVELCSAQRDLEDLENELAGI